MDRTSFLKANGQEWSAIIQSRSFMEGMSLLSLERLDKIRDLTDAELRDNAVLILADLRGALQHESQLFDLAQPPEAEMPDLESAQYVNSVDENFAEHQRNNPPKQ